jgi:hypothetical protein
LVTGYYEKYEVDMASFPETLYFESDFINESDEPVRRSNL